MQAFQSLPPCCVLMDEAFRMMYCVGGTIFVDLAQEIPVLMDAVNNDFDYYSYTDE